VSESGTERRCATRQSYRLNGPLECAQCDELSGPDASGWRAYRTDEPEMDDLPALAFFCPICVINEFGDGVTDADASAGT
jgi:hypothetical protein